MLLGLAAAAAVLLAVLALALNHIARQVERGVDPKTRARVADHLLTIYQLHVDPEMLPMILGRRATLPVTAAGAPRTARMGPQVTSSQPASVVADQQRRP